MLTAQQQEDHRRLAPLMSRMMAEGCNDARLRDGILRYTDTAGRLRVVHAAQVTDMTNASACVGASLVADASAEKIGAAPATRSSASAAAAGGCATVAVAAESVSALGGAEASAAANAAAASAAGIWEGPPPLTPSWSLTVASRSN